MDRPSLDKPITESGGHFRLVARTQSIEEANRIAEQHQMKGFETKIIKRTEGGISLYEVWAGKKDALSAV